MSPITTGTLLAKAPFDACYYGIGLNKVTDDGYKGVPVQASNCTRLPNGQPKVNQAYIWAITSAGSGGNDIWFGTMANTQCAVQGNLGLDFPAATPDNAYVCEFGSSAWEPDYSNNPPIGDLRPSRIYWYNATSGLHQVTPSLLDGPNAGWQPTQVDQRLLSTVGLRSAVTLPGSLSGNPSGTPDMVVLAGPALPSANGINLFVFNATTHAYMGSYNLPQYSDIRKWATYTGSTGSGTYAAVANNISTINPNGSKGAGSVLLYSGVQNYTATVNGRTVITCHNCPRFNVVGLLPSEGAYITSYLGRLFVTTWPGLVGYTYEFAALVMGPPVPNNGRLPASTTLWKTLWSADHYEPDLAVASTYGGGALMPFGGYLYWGTMHEPFQAPLTAQALYGAPAPGDPQVAMWNGTQRAGAIFRATNLTSTTGPSIDLLYGDAQLPQYQPLTQTWTLVPNLMNATPLYGPSGFGNPYNNYIWSMAIWNNELWIGTMNWALLYNEDAPGLAASFGEPPDTIEPTPLGPGTAIPYGANLAYFSSSSGPAVYQDNSGLGNYLNYGVRNLLVVGNTMYAGMANPMNLKTNPAQDMLGGWELIQFTATAGH